MIAFVARVVGWLVARRTTRPLEALTDVVDEGGETQDLEGSDPRGRRG
ncbi:MAG: hypothetical protein M9922_15660 [Microthrixaceae bacterium]|nr:hypothetical protein [Microthrixaceae bacterium]